MRVLNIFLLLMIVFLLMVPRAFAFYRDEGQGAEEPSMVEEIMHKRDYQEMMKEKKKLIKEAIPVREKRKATLTPFVYDTPQELADLESWRKANAKTDKKLSPKMPSKPPPASLQIDVNKEISGSILMNLIVIAISMAGIIFLLISLRAKK